MESAPIVRTHPCLLAKHTTAHCGIRSVDITHHWPLLQVSCHRLSATCVIDYLRYSVRIENKMINRPIRRSSAVGLSNISIILHCTVTANDRMVNYYLSYTSTGPVKEMTRRAWQSQTWGRPAPQVRVQNQFQEDEIPLAVMAGRMKKLSENTSTIPEGMDSSTLNFKANFVFTFFFGWGASPFGCVQ